MKHPKNLVSRWLLAPVRAALLLATAQIGVAAPFLVIDGRDVGNLAGEGNHATWHNPPVSFAFTFGGVAADNPTVGPGDPPTATDTAFNYTGNDFGGLGFGVSPDVVFPAALSYAVIDLTVNAANTLPSLTLNLKDRDFVPPIFSNIEEHQYPIPLGAAGTKRIWVPLAAPSFTNNPSPVGSVGQGPDFDPDLGLTELQLQYPFGQGGSGAVLDVTISRIAIQLIPEPTTVSLIGLGGIVMGAFGFRGRRIG